MIGAADASQRIASHQKVASSVPAQTTNMGRVVVTDKLADLADLWPRTGDLRGARCHPFQCADVLEVWLQTIGAAQHVQPCLVAVLGPDDRPQMLLPFGIRRTNGTRILSFLDGSVSDYNAPVLFPHDREWNASAVEQLWRRVSAALPAVDAVILQKMPAYVQDLVNPLVLLPTTPHAESGHRITLTGNWPDFEAQRLPRRKDGRRKLRKLSALGPTTFEVAETPEQIKAFFDAMVDNKQRQFVRTRVPGFEVPGKLDYFVEMTRRHSLPGPVHLSALKVGESIIASHWGLIVGGCFYHMMSSHADGQWEYCSPGRLLNDFLIRESFRLKLEVFDFGIGDESYKHEYCDDVVRLHDFIDAQSIVGQLYLRIKAGMERLRRTALWQAIRPYKWVLLRALRR